MNRRVEFDDGPLSWVKGEIDLSMQRGLQALQAFAAGDAAQIKASVAKIATSTREGNRRRMLSPISCKKRLMKTPERRPFNRSSLKCPSGSMPEM